MYLYWGTSFEWPSACFHIENHMAAVYCCYAWRGTWEGQTAGEGGSIYIHTPASVSCGVAAAIAELCPWASQK